MIQNSTNPNKQEIDFVQTNIDDFQVPEDSKLEKKLQTRIMHRNRQVIAKQCRDILTEERAKNKILQLHRWEILRRKKSEATAEALEEIRESYKLQKLVKYALTWHVLGAMYAKFRERVAQEAVFQRQVTAAELIQKEYRSILQKRGENPDDRSIKKFRNSLNAHNQATRDIIIERAQRVMSYYLLKANQFFQFRKEWKHTHNMICAIQNRFRVRKQILSLKMQSLIDQFDRERAAMSSYCYKKVKNKKNKALYTQLACLDDNRRDAVLSEYMEACKMVYRIKATLNYTWKVSNNLDDVIQLFQEDYTFIKM